MGYGKFDGCGCCGGLTLCEPRDAGVGQVSWRSWWFGSVNPPDEESDATLYGLSYPDKIWRAELTFAASGPDREYTFTFEQPYTRTFFLPTVQPPAAGWESFWLYEKLYFSEAVPVHFLSSELTITATIPLGGGSEEILPSTPEADELEDVLGVNPFLATLSVWPLSSTVSTAPNEVLYPSDFSSYRGYPDFATRPIQEHVEVSWITQKFPFGSYATELSQYSGWLWGDSPIDFSGLFYSNQYFINHPRGWTFLPSGLGPLDETINEFELGFDSVSGTCYPTRTNEFFTSLKVTIGGWGNRGSYTEEEAPEQYRIGHALNGEYVCEYMNTDGFGYLGRNDSWICFVAPKFHHEHGLGLPAYDPLTEGDDPVGDVAVASIHFDVRHDLFAVQLFRYLDGVVPAVAGYTFNDVSGWPGVSSFQEGGLTQLWVSDPTAFIVHAAALATWEVLPFDYPAAVWGFDNPVLSVSIAASE